MKKVVVWGVLFGLVGLVLLAVLVWTAGKTSAPDRLASPAQKGVYVAFGDSVAAGLGLRPQTDPACGRSSLAYPDRVATVRSLDLTAVTCSGATYQAGIRGPQTTGGQTKAAQLSTLPDKPPALVSLTAGANDIRWTDTLRQCYQADCGSYADTLTTEAASKQVALDIAASMQAIKQKYPAKPPRVVVTGYYQVLPDQRAADCLELVGLDSREQAWWREQERLLNGVLADAVRPFPFVRFAAVDFSGHDSCTSDPWVQNLTDPAPFHPTANGQAAIAEAVLNAVR